MVLFLLLYLALSGAAFHTPREQVSEEEGMKGVYMLQGIGNESSEQDRCDLRCVVTDLCRGRGALWP